MEPDNRKDAYRDRLLLVCKSQTRAWHGRPLINFDDDLNFQTAYSKADDQHIQARQKRGELNSIQLRLDQ